MEYVKLWTTFHDDPSIQNLSARAIVYYVNALSWAGRHETGGVFVPVGKVPAAARELIAAGKFEARDDGGPGWRIHGWPERQVDMDDLRAKRKQAGRLGGLAKAGKRLASASVPAPANGRVPDLAELEVEEEVEDKEPKPIAPRKRDAMFEAVCEACGIDWGELTDTARGSLNKAVAQIRAVCQDPDEVGRRAQNWPYETPLTPPALAKHWPNLGTKRTSSSLLRAVDDVLEGKA